MLYLHNSDIIRTVFQQCECSEREVGVVNEIEREAGLRAYCACAVCSTLFAALRCSKLWLLVKYLHFVTDLCLCQLLNRFNAFGVLLFRQNSLQLLSHRWVIVSNARFAHFFQNLQCFALARCNTLQRQCTDPQTLAILVYSVITRAFGRCRALARDSTTPSRHKSVTFRLTGSVLFVVLR